MKLVLKVFPSRRAAENYYREDIIDATGNFVAADSRRLVIEYQSRKVQYIVGGRDSDVENFMGLQPDKVSYPCGIMEISPIVKSHLMVSVQQSKGKQ